MAVSGKPKKKTIKGNKMQDSVKAKRKYVRKVKTPVTKKVSKAEAFKPKRKYTKKELSELSKVKKPVSEKKLFIKKYKEFMKANGVANKFVQAMNELNNFFNRFAEEEMLK
jgi:hypothetical protein